MRGRPKGAPGPSANSGRPEYGLSPVVRGIVARHVRRADHEAETQLLSRPFAHEIYYAVSEDVSQLTVIVDRAWVGEILFPPVIFPPVNSYTMMLTAPVSFSSLDPHSRRTYKCIS